MLFIGLDVGTTGTKAVVVDNEGRILGKGYREYELAFPQDGWVEQNAEDWWIATVSAIREATAALPDRNAIAGIGLSTQGATMLAADDNGRPLAPAITWMDNRATKQAAAMVDAFGEESVYRKTGWRISPTCDASKIRWIKETQPDVFRNAACFVSTLEFINFRLCGHFVIDPTNAAIRQMLDIRPGEWDAAILDFVGVTPDRLPTVQPIGRLVGTLTPDAAAALGLSPAVKVFNGAHDQYCSALGAGAVNSGDMLLATGTTWVVLGVTERPLYTDSYISPGIHPTAGRYGAMASLVSAGSALKWYRSVVGVDFKDLDAKAAARAASATDLLFYPYLCGAGFPHGRPAARGTLIGLDLHHDKYDIARALMEGVAFETALTLEQFSKQGMDVHRLMMTGGASKSTLWSELVGYVTGCEIFRTAEANTACLGAAMIAAVGLGAFADYDAAAAVMVKSEPLPLPDPALFAFYKEKFGRYRRQLDRMLNAI